jgi:hypothetical protein
LAIGDGRITPIAYGGGSATPNDQNSSKTFENLPMRWPNHPHRPRGWFDHPQASRSGGGRTTLADLEDGSTTPKGQKPSKTFEDLPMGW